MEEFKNHSSLNDNKRGKHTKQITNKNSRKAFNKNKTNIIDRNIHTTTSKVAQKRKINKKKLIIVIAIFILIIFLIVRSTKTTKTSAETNTSQTNNISENTNQQNEQPEQQPEEKPKKQITDWRLLLANYDNILPEDFTVEVANIDSTRQFDARAIGYLNQMMNDMRKDGITNVWVQSAYRSVERQKELYDNSIQKYLKQGKTQEEAIALTDEYINKPGSSDHNLGLAVDFNNVDNSFAKLKGYQWLLENAENYGFILRYPEDKEDITKIAYESWHWRYVGEENAKKMNELHMCLEEYVEYLSEQE